MQDNRLIKTLLAVGIFAIAMAYLETAVVVYLRSLYYPEGFTFPLKIMPQKILLIELMREAATIVMLAAVAWIAGSSFLGRFAFFSYAFSIWDIFYYVFLKFTINWPASLNDWDILFLIPLPWIAPVLAPIIVSLSLIVASIIVLHQESLAKPVTIPLTQWIFLILGGVIVIVSFLQNQNAALQHSYPVAYNWYVFSLGILLGLSAFVWTLRK